MKYSIKMIMGVAFLAAYESGVIAAQLNARREIRKDCHDVFVENIHQIPKFCADLARRLDEQPLNGAKKKLSLVNFDDGVIYRIINFGANKFLDLKQQWKISTHHKIDGIGEHWEQELILHNDGVNKPVAFKDLQNAYEQVLQELKAGWVARTLQENSGQAWVLLVKKMREVEGEDILINLLAKKFAMGGCMQCSAESHGNELHLWVCKDALEKFQKVFSFELRELQI